MLVRSFAGERTSELSPMLARFLATFPGEPPMSADRLLMTLINRDLLRARFLQQMESWPVLLMPVTTAPAFRHGEGGWRAGDPANYLVTMRFTQWFNLLGLPAAVVPVAHLPEGLPIGVQVVGRPYEEEVVLEVASVIEEGFGYKAPAMNWADASAAGD
jgi:Asp-tRNA(Asn)/Glu-tRNA(Gln) amidotransferase A subunit family amidase